MKTLWIAIINWKKASLVIEQSILIDNLYLYFQQTQFFDFILMFSVSSYLCGALIRQHFHYPRLSVFSRDIFWGWDISIRYLNSLIFDFEVPKWCWFSLFPDSIFQCLFVPKYRIYSVVKWMENYSCQQVI